MADFNGELAGSAVSYEESHVTPVYVGEVLIPGPAGSPVGSYASGTMASVIIGTGTTYPVNVLLCGSTGAGLTGATALLKVRRASDNQYLDWADMTFKAAGWTTIAATMTEVSGANEPGAYSYSFATGSITNPVAGDTYLYRADATGAAVPERGEIRVSALVDRVDVVVSTRATSAAVAALPTALTIADAVWDESATAHVTAGTFGYVVSAIPDSAAIAVWSVDPLDYDTPSAGYALAQISPEVIGLGVVDAAIAGASAGTVGAALATASGYSIPSPATIAAAVVAQPIAGAAAGTVGAALVTSSGYVMPSPAAVAAAVWDLDIASYGTYAQATLAGGALYALKILALNRMEESAGTPGTVTIYRDGGTVVYATVQLRDGQGGAVLPTVGEPARRSQAA